MSIAKFEITNAFSTGKEGYDPEREQREQLVAEARKEGYDEGFRAGHQQALSEIEAKTSTTLDQLIIALNALFEDRAATETKLMQESAVLALQVGNKLAKHILSQKPLAEIETLINESLLAGYNQPKITISVSPETLDSVKERVDGFLTSTGFTGELQYLADPAMGPQDCRIEWPNGGVSRNFAGLEAEIDRRISDFLGVPVEQAQAELESTAGTADLDVEEASVAVADEREPAPADDIDNQAESMETGNAAEDETI